MTTWSVTALLLLGIFSPAWLRTSRENLGSSKSFNAITEDMHRLRPFIHGAMALGGALYTIRRGEAGAGVDFDTKNYLVRADVRFQDSRWVFSNTGHIVSADAFAARKTGTNWYLGGGLQGNRLATDTKQYQGLRPMLVTVRDVMRRDFSMQIQGKYFLPALDGSKDRPGGEFGLYLPSPHRRIDSVLEWKKASTDFLLFQDVPVTKTS